MTDQDNFQVAQQLIGRSISPAAARASRQLCVDTYGRPHPLPLIASLADQDFGTHARHKMDVYFPKRPPRGIVLFVHGGGYTSGDKTLDDGLYHALTAQWLNELDLIAVTMNYRLAPGNTWPDAAQDVLAAHRHLSTRNLLPEPVRKLPLIWWGHSAGASHVADALALATCEQERPSAALLMSGTYDLSLEPDRPSQQQYYGSNGLADRSSLAALAQIKTPLCLIHAELDPAFFLMQKTRLADARRQHQQTDTLLLAKGHNHFTQLYHLGLHESSFSLRLKHFLQHRLS